MGLSLPRIMHPFHRSHEWLKHGTCATGISSMNTEYGFFSTVLSLFAKYNYTSVLEHRGITPSNTTAYNVMVVPACILET